MKDRTQGRVKYNTRTKESREERLKRLQCTPETEREDRRESASSVKKRRKNYNSKDKTVKGLAIDLADYINIFCVEDETWYAATVLSINADKTEIRVCYDDGLWETEKIRGLIYEHFSKVPPKQLMFFEDVIAGKQYSITTKGEVIIEHPSKAEFSALEQEAMTVLLFMSKRQDNSINGAVVTALVNNQKVQVRFRYGR